MIADIRSQPVAPAPLESAPADFGRPSRAEVGGAWKAVDLAAWGRTSLAPCLAARPERFRELRIAAAAPPERRQLLAHGAGRSYGDVGLNTGGAVLLTERLDRILAFDPASGLVACEPGVTFADLLQAFLPRGFLAPASPGTAFATLGGAVANDVHGKNHHRDGSFGNHVAWLDLLLPDGRLVRASPDENADLFLATIGGIGLTGIIAAICVRLARVPSNALVVRRRRIADLDAFLAGFEAAAGAAWSVGWIDAMSHGTALGRGILETAEASPDALPERARRHRTVPFDLPSWLLNRLSVRAFNEAYWRRVPAGPDGHEAMVGYARFLYPLDAIGRWNRLYGRRGFHQFQCVLPHASAPAALRRLLEVAARSGGASFLAVLKAMGPAGRGLLSFPMPGFTLALDFPARPGTASLFAEFERLTLDAGGRVYLAKDSLLSPAGFVAMYPGAARFRQIRDRWDPERRMSSDMARRLDLA